MKSALILVLCTFILIGVFSDEVSVKEGDSVTLHTNWTEIQKDDDIEWRLNGTLTAQISSGSKGITESISADDVAFRVRLQLDKQTGDLKITNFKTTDSGEYKLQITSTRGSSAKIFNVKGVASADRDAVKPVPVMKGDSVTLNTKIQQDDVIRWRFENSPIAEVNRKAGNFATHDEPGGRFRHRLQLDYLTGSLTIKDIRTTHSGLYEADIRRSGYTLHKSFSVTVSDKDAVKPVSVTEGDSVTLNSGLTKVQTDDEILWMFGETHIAEIIKAKPHISDGRYDRFRDRLKLDNQTGSLTITNIRTTDTGDYEVTISGSKYTVHKRIPVTVTDVKSESVMEGSFVHLQTGVTEKLRNDQILWKFGDEVIPIARLKDPNVGTKWSNIDMNEQTGDLNIANIRANQFGDYKVEITSSTILRKKFRINMIDSGWSAGPKALVGCLAAAAAAVVVLIAVGYRMYRKKRTHWVILAVTERDTIILIPYGTKIPEGADIELKFEGKLIAERKAKGELTVHDESFKGRLQLVKKYGFLIITEAAFEDSGQYELQIRRWWCESLKKFIVSVCDPENPHERFWKNLHDASLYSRAQSGCWGCCSTP